MGYEYDQWVSDDDIRENAPTRGMEGEKDELSDRLVPRRYSDPRDGSGIVKEDESLIASILEEEAKTWSLEKGSGCGCGRSPTGSCVGWHKLTEEQYDKTLKEYLDTPDSDKHSFFKPKNKKELTKEEAFNAIVEGLNIMSEGLGGGIDKDIIKANPLLAGIDEPWNPPSGAIDPDLEDNDNSEEK